MAKETRKELANMTIYQVYVRNHGPNGTFADVKADLDRIQALNVDVVYFMPIHIIGQLNRKGSLGSPYSIKDFRSVNPEYGTEEEFRDLVADIHSRDMKVMIDVVYNHTAHDAIYIEEHPDWYNMDEEGKPFTTVPAWSDIIDLKHPNEELSTYLIGSLTYWVGLGVDGFRCDVGSLLPIEFWRRAREACAKIKRDTMWLTESVHMNFVRERRRAGLFAISDSELYQVFDMAYDYDIWPIWEAAVAGKQPVERYLEMLQLQDSIYPKNFIKMRCVENHDQRRIQDRTGDKSKALAWTAFMAFNKGPFFIYAGQESAETHRPTLFDIDKVNWADYELSDVLSKLAVLKHDSAQVNGLLTFLAAEPVIQAVWENGDESLYGLFNVAGAGDLVEVQLPDGVYPDLLGGEKFSVLDGKCCAPESAVIVRYAMVKKPKEFTTVMMDSHVE